MLPKVSRRDAVKLIGTTAVAGKLASSATRRVPARAAPVRQDVHVIVHWSCLTASDGEFWAELIDAFNDAHVDHGVRIRSECVLPC